MSLASVSAAAQVSPARWWGELGYDYRAERFEGGGDLTEHAGILRLNGSTYLYRPWIATLQGGIGFDLRSTDLEAGDSTGENVTGNVVVRILPQGRYPLELYADKSDSRTDTDLTGLDIERDRYGFLQRYSTEGGAAMRLGYEHTNTRTLSVDGAQARDEREDVTDLWRAGYDQSFGAHTVSFDANVTEVDRMNSPALQRTTFSTLRHAYRPGPTFSAEDMLTYNGTDRRQEGADFNTGLIQFNSFGFWRPVTERPLRLSGTLRVLQRDTESGLMESSATSSTGTVGATYEASRRWVLNANAGATTVSVEGDEQNSSFQAFNGIYTSRDGRFAGMNASWFGQVDVRNNIEPDDSVQAAGGQLGYNLNKVLFSDRRSSLEFDARQSASTVADTDDFASETLLSSLALTWNRAQNGTASMARFSFSDSRTEERGDVLRNVEGDFQIVNLQASVDHRLGRSSTVSGNFTLQATRDYKPMFEAMGDSTNGEWQPTAIVDLTYFDTRVFGVPRLTFRSTARFISDSYFPALADPSDPDGREDAQWENRLEYTVGRMQFRAIARLSEINDMGQTFILFQARRFFGDL